MLRNLLRRAVIRRATFDRLTQEHEELIEVTRKSTHSKSEYFQDLWIVGKCNAKRSGFFVEVGAFDGISSSNTWLLEKFYGWDGIAVEPSKSNFKNLSENRSCICDSRAVWNKSGENLLFSERSEGYLSSVSEGNTSLQATTQYFVRSVSLTDLLIEYNAPVNIDYVSIDIEGSELTVLKQFFLERKFNVKYFTIEHNWREDKIEILSLMGENGYLVEMGMLAYRDFFFVKRD